MNDVSAQFSNVSKSFGDVNALRGLTLAVPRGSVLGLLGRNGAGKSTALRTLVGLERPDGGSVSILDRDPLALDVTMRQRVGYLSEDGIPFPAATTEKMIRLCAPLYPNWNRSLEDQVLARFQIDPRRRLRHLSLGQRRAVALMLAVCPQPEVLILDEPAANLDAVMRREFLETVLGLVSAEDAHRTVIFSSHILSDVERIADRVAILDHGRLLIERPLDELKDQVRRLRLMFAHAVPGDLDLSGLLAVRRAGREMLATVIGYDDHDIADLATQLDARFEVQRIGLEDLFIDLVGDDAAAPAIRG
jgi:ABC-2 type transport system ATP-binding protein